MATEFLLNKVKFLMGIMHALIHISLIPQHTGEIIDPFGKKTKQNNKKSTTTTPPSSSKNRTKQKKKKKKKNNQKDEKQKTLHPQ